jgi:nitrilase
VAATNFSELHHSLASIKMGSTAPASTFRVAVAQYEPVWLDLEGSVKKACSIITEAASKGAKLVAFSEAFIPGYPGWIW